MAKFKNRVSGLATGDLAASLLLILIVVFSVHPSAAFKPPENDLNSPAIAISPTPDDKDQPAPIKKTIDLAPSPPPTKPPKPVTPSSVLSLTNWRLTLPIDTAHAGSPDSIRQPELATFSLSPYFQLNPNQNAVIFRAHVGGATTSGSSYPRSELREMINSGRQETSWSNSSGSHSMTIRQAITHLPPVKPEVVSAQIHDASDDVVMVRLENKHLFIEAAGQNIGDLDSNYILGSVFTVQLVAAEGHIKVFYNGVLKVDYAMSGAGYYFKTGCYTQSNPSKGDAPGEYGEVVIYDLQVSHY